MTTSRTGLPDIVAMPGQPRAQTRAEWLRREPFTLLLSAGFFGFFAHAGVLTALEERALVPGRIVGISAGALAGGLWASGLNARQLTSELVGLRRSDFWDPGLPLGGVLRGRKFTRALERVLEPTGHTQLEHCRIPFSAVVHDVWTGRPVCLDSGSIVRAIQASCTVPGMFRPVVVGRRLWVDGGVSDRYGVCGLRERERVLLHGLLSRRRGVAPPPSLDDALTLVIDELPKVGPFRLRYGVHALERARDYTRRWLDQRIPARDRPASDSP